MNLSLRLSEQAENSGHNGFDIAYRYPGMHKVLQAAGRLIRSTSDRGVVAVLDPRLIKARYSGFLRASLPPFWTTTDAEVAIQALQRLGTS